MYRRETPADRFLAAARVPLTLEPQAFGQWEILRQDLDGVSAFVAGCRTMTVLTRWTEATLHKTHGEVVMEDSLRELRRHVPIWLAAKGRVLKTGLGLGCVVRGLLAKPEVEHVDVVEIDADIIRVIGAEFRDEPRVEIHHADALTWDFGDRRWDCAWHDIWCPGNHGLELLHAELIARFLSAAGGQGAWAFPREVSRMARVQLIGAPRVRRAAA
jgi:hypothetical protein